MEKSIDRPPLAIMVATDRPALRAFLDTLGFALRDAPEDADVAVVDVAVDPAAGAAACLALHGTRPELPIAALVCCPHAVTPWALQQLLAGGVSAILDLQMDRDETARTLESVARGASVLHLQLRRGHRQFLRDLLTGVARVKTQARLLELVALGLPDHEIGRRLYLSPHTVKHQIEQLRRDLRVRNRTELAAWAGRHGFYAPEASDAVPMHLAR
jgi:DNA-binding NarL/FixJ family response regulator